MSNANDADSPDSSARGNPYESPRLLDDSQRRFTVDADRRSRRDNALINADFLADTELAMQLNAIRRWTLVMSLGEALLAAVSGLQLYGTFNTYNTISIYQTIVVASTLIPVVIYTACAMQLYRWSNRLAQFDIRPTVACLRETMRVQHALWRTFGVCTLVYIGYWAVAYATAYLFWR